jgi:hypothetical protein
MNPVNLDLGDRAALEARQQDSAQAVSDGMAESTLEGLDVKLTKCVGQRFAIADHPAG